MTKNNYLLEFKEAVDNISSLPGWNCIIYDPTTRIKTYGWGETRDEAQIKAYQKIEAEINKFLNNASWLKENVSTTKLGTNQASSPSPEYSHAIDHDEEDENSDEDDLIDQEEPETEEDEEDSSNANSVEPELTGHTFLKASIIAAVMLAVLAGGWYVYNSLQKQEDSIANSISTNALATSINPNPSPAPEPIKEQNISQPNSNNAGATAQFYIINVAAYATESDAIQRANKLRESGYNAGYLWIPDYGSLSGARLYCTYIGPFSTQRECEIETENYRKKYPGAYGLLVSQEKKRVQINGLGKVVVTELNSGNNTTCSDRLFVGDEGVFITGDNVRVRTRPASDDDRTIMFRLNKNNIAKVIDKTTNEKGELWYNVCFAGQAGWVISDYADIFIQESEE